jgi:hypothetical protein
MQFQIEGTTFVKLDEEAQEKRFVIPDGITQIKRFAFYSCKQVEEVVIPDSVTEIGDCAFMYSGLTSLVVPDSVTEMGREICSECRRLTRAVIGRGITRLRERTFEYCQSLEHLELPEGLERIESRALEECYSLRTVWVNGKEYRIRDPEAPKPVQLVYDHLEDIRDRIRAYYESGAMDEFEYIDYQIAGDGYDY